MNPYAVPIFVSIALVLGLFVGWIFRGKPSVSVDPTAHDRLDELEKRVDMSDAHHMALMKVLEDIRNQRATAQDRLVTEARAEMAKMLGLKTPVPDPPVTQPPPMRHAKL